MNSFAWMSYSFAGLDAGPLVEGRRVCDWGQGQGADQARAVGVDGRGGIKEKAPLAGWLAGLLRESYGCPIPHYLCPKSTTRSQLVPQQTVITIHLSQCLTIMTAAQSITLLFCN
jgi:hypothetical protein